MKSARRFPFKVDEMAAATTTTTTTTTTAAVTATVAATATATVTEALSPSQSLRLDIPEVITLIFSFLDQHTLRTAAAVCRVWFNVAQETLVYHLQLRNYKSEAWNSFEERLHAANSLTVGLQLGPWRQPVSDRGTNLWNENVMPLVCHSLQGDKCTQLQKVSLIMPLGEMRVPLDQILTQCPKLALLFVSCRQVVPQEHLGLPPPPLLLQQQAIIAIGSEREIFFCAAFPLTSLHLVGVRLSPQAFLSYVPCLQNLTDLSLLEIRDPWDTAAFVAATKNDATLTHLFARAEEEVVVMEEEEDGAGLLGPDIDGGGEDPRALFWRAVGRYCPKLKRIRFSCHDEISSAAPLEYFPTVAAWGVDSRCIQASNSTWMALHRRAIEHRLISLEILRDQDPFSEEETNSGRDLLLWELLCTCPSLEHFKAIHVSLSTRVLWGEGAHSLDGTFRATATAARAWNCRGLKTLTLSLIPEDDDWTDPQEIDILTRRIFRYLGRMCPQLQELTLEVPCRLYAMESGLCLLTRLQHLRQLAIYTSFSDNSLILPVPQKQNFVWMQGIAYHQGMVTAIAPQPTGLPYVRRVSAFEDHKQCLDIFSMWSTVVHDVGPGGPQSVEERRHKMQQQQIQYKYLSSSEEPESPLHLTKKAEAPIHLTVLPKVDGLVDLEYCGSFMDMEALLRARMDRFKKEAEKYEDFSRQWEDAASGPEGVQPWPRLEQVVLSNGSVDRVDLASVRNQAELAQTYMSELRPDVKVICQYSEYPHLLLLDM